MFKRLIFLIPVLCLGFGFDGKIPNFRLKNLNNKPVSYSQLKGEELTVIDFWATWCKPCVRSIPKLVKIYERYREKGVTFIGISVDSPRNLSKVKPLARSLGIAYPVLLDMNSQVMTELKVTSVPSLLIVNKNDEIVSFHQGYRPGDEEIIEEEIRDLLEKAREEIDEE